MILNPQDLYDRNIVSTENPEIKDSIDNFIQQNGIDVDLDRLFEIQYMPNGKGIAMPFIGKDKSVKTDVIEVKPHETSDGKRVFVLDSRKTYTFDSSFSCEFPANICGEVVGRSSLNRQGVFIRSSWFDAGFNGTVSATIYPSTTMMIERGARVAQIVCRECTSAKMYSGQYQKS